MDDGQEQDQYEERLREVFHSFDASASGSLSPEELSDLCQSLQLGDATPALLHRLLLDQDHLTGRVDFDQFKHALILVLSSTVETPQAEEETLPKPDSPEIQPKFVKGSKRYGRRSTPEFIEPVPEFFAVSAAEPAEEGGDAGAEEEEEEEGDTGDSAVPRKRERWNARETSPEEYEAEGQLHLWNPDEPGGGGTPRGSMGPLSEPLSERLEERLREACGELDLPRDGCASQAELLGLCVHLGLEVPGDVLQSLSGDEVVDIREFVSRVLNPCKPPTPSASTPYRQLKRHHSSQPFDESGRRIATPSAMTSTIATRLFSTLDDGTGYTPVESVLDAWVEEGIENSLEILQALDFNLDGKLNLGELTTALENELLVTKNGIHQAALASFKAEIRHLMEQVDRELREKEKIRSDLEKAEKLKSQLATEVDEHHSAIEHMNNLNLRKLEQEHKEKVATVRAELTEEMDHVQQQAGLQREGLEAEMEKIRDDETFLRDHLSISIKENRRLEIELLENTERLIEAHSQVTKLQTNMDNILKEKFGELDPGCADFFLQEERINRLRSGYEEQCRELQDRIDELQSELQDFHLLGRGSQSCKPLSEELESKSPGNESDPGIGSEEVQPFSMSLEAEMMLEQLKEQHLRELEDLQAQLQSKVSEFEQKVAEQREAHEEHKSAISLRYLEDVQALEAEMATAQTRSQTLQNQLEQAELERASLGERQAGERTDLEHRQEEEVGALRRQLSEAHGHAAGLEERLKGVEARQAMAKLNLDIELEELKTRHALELNKLEEEQEELMEYRLEEERLKRHEERAQLVKRLLEEWEKEKEELKQTHEEELKARLEETGLRLEAEREELELRLTERWEKERAQLEEQSNESLQAVLEEGMLGLLKEQEEKESTLREQWEIERTQLQESQEEVLLTRLAEERSRSQEQHEERERKLGEEWEREKLQLEEDYEGMLQDRLSEEREELEARKEEMEKRLGQLLEEEKTRLVESHREALQELTAKHGEEREELSGTLDKLREDIAEERKNLENHFSQKIKEVEDRFSGDQESVAERFQTDVLKFEQHYQAELKALAESHAEQKLKWEAEMEKALQEAEEKSQIVQETLEQERETINQEWAKVLTELEGTRKEEMEALVTKNQELQKELDDIIGSSQTKEIELSRQLNDLHDRLQESQETRDELLAQSNKKTLEIELLLNQAVIDFKLERAELQNSLSELEEKHKETLSQSDEQIEERIEMLTERDDLKMKIEELEMLLKQAAVDFEHERRELQENVCIVEDKLKDNRSHCEQQENERVELVAERDLLSVRVKELEDELTFLLASAEIAEKKEMEELNEVDVLVDEVLRVSTSIALDERETCSKPLEVGEETGDDEAAVGGPEESVAPVEQTLNDNAEIIVEPSDEYETCPNDDIADADACNVGETEQGQDDEEEEKEDDVEMAAETPDSVEGCTENVEGGDAVECAGGAPADEDDVPVEVDAIEKQEQIDDAAEEETMMTMDEDKETCPEEERGQSEDNCEDSCPDNVTPDVPEENKREDSEDERDVAEVQHEASSTPEVLEHEDAGEEGTDCEKKAPFEPCEEESEPQGGEDESPPDRKESCHETAVGPSGPEGTGDRVNLTLWDVHICCLPSDANERGQEGEPVSRRSVGNETNSCAREQLDQNGQCEDYASSLSELRSLYSNATGENLLLHQKIALLQQKTEMLENLLAHSNEKIELGHQALEENYNLKVKMHFIMEQAKELELKSLDMTGLEIRYEDSILENAKLKEHNGELQRRVSGLESRMHIVHDLGDHQTALVDEIARMREENSKLCDLVSELERQDEILLALHQEAASSTETPRAEPSQDLDVGPEATIPPLSDLEDCCEEFEKQNAKLRRAVAELQGKSLMINWRIQAHRCEATRLAEENLVLRSKIAKLKEEDIREELLQKLERLRKEKVAAQKMAENLKMQISGLLLRSQQLEDENGLLSEKNAQNAAGVEELSHQLAELMRESKKEATPAEERTQMAACVSALEAELITALEGTAQLEKRNGQLTEQLSGLRGKVATVDHLECQLSHLLQERKTGDKEAQVLYSQLSKAQDKLQTHDASLQTVNFQNARLKSDLRVTQQEKDALKNEVVSLHKQLKNAVDKSRTLEVALHTSGLQSPPHKKLYREELARLVEQEQQPLRQENQRLVMEVRSTKGDLVLSREKVKQLETSVLSLKQQQQQQGPSCLASTLEQENASLKQELEELRLLTKGCENGDGHGEMETLKQENEALKSQMARLHSQLLESFQSQLAGLLPPSPHRIPRGQHRGDDPDHVQDESDRKMKIVVDRMTEIELSLRNVKLLLREKVAQLKEQRYKNGRADVLIEDLYVENAELLKALELTEQRQKIAEKKNYLLEEKISSLNKIVRDLNPSPLPPSPYRYTRS